MEQNEKCIKARLVASKADGVYKIYVFENTNLAVDHPYKFITCTRCPNWHGEEPVDLQEGFITYKYVRGGIDEYFHKVHQDFRTYLDTKMYFLDFVPITHVLNNGYVVAKNSLKVS